MGKRNHQGFGIEIILRGSSCLISWKLVHPQSLININDSEDFLWRSVCRSAPRLFACLVTQLPVWVAYGLLVCLSRLSIVCLSVCLFSTQSLNPWLVNNVVNYFNNVEAIRGGHRFTLSFFLAKTSIQKSPIIHLFTQTQKNTAHIHETLGINLDFVKFCLLFHISSSIQVWCCFCRLPSSVLSTLSKNNNVRS